MLHIFHFDASFPNPFPHLPTQHSGLCGVSCLHTPLTKSFPTFLSPRCAFPHSESFPVSVFSFLWHDSSVDSVTPAQPSTAQHNTVLSAPVSTAQPNSSHSCCLTGFSNINLPFLFFLVHKHAYTLTHTHTHTHTPSSVLYYQPHNLASVALSTNTNFRKSICCTYHNPLIFLEIYDAPCLSLAKPHFTPTLLPRT
jgi:hypothetical protein